MASLVWVRRKVNLCEVCNRVMKECENYANRCPVCGSDYCKNCVTDTDLCITCKTTNQESK